MTRLLDLRNRQKRRKPDFAMPDCHKRKELRKRWVKPQGKHAKIRLHKKGHRRMPSQGYRSPEAVRGYSREGLKIVVVSNVGGLKRIVDSKQDGALIAHVGIKKRVEIIKAALAQGITVLNIRKPAEYLGRLEAEQADKKAVRVEGKKAAGKKPKAKSSELEAGSPKLDKSLEDVATEKEKKKLDKQEKDKLLTRREL